MSDTTDIVARLASMSADHGPDGWPAVRMREITALCEEVTRLRAALAQAVAGAGREPVASVSRSNDMEGLVQWADKRLPVGTLLYAHPSPAQREPLSNVEIDAATAVARDALMDHVAEYGTIAEGQQRHIRDIARAIERAHGIGTKGAARTEDTAPGAGERGNVEVTGPRRR